MHRNPGVLCWKIVDCGKPEKGQARLVEGERSKQARLKQHTPRTAHVHSATAVTFALMWSDNSGRSSIHNGAGVCRGKALGKVVPNCVHPSKQGSNSSIQTKTDDLSGNRCLLSNGIPIHGSNPSKYSFKF